MEYSIVCYSKVEWRCRPGPKAKRSFFYHRAQEEHEVKPAWNRNQGSTVQTANQTAEKHTAQPACGAGAGPEVSGSCYFSNHILRQPGIVDTSSHSETEEWGDTEQSAGLKQDVCLLWNWNFLLLDFRGMKLKQYNPDSLNKCTQTWVFFRNNLLPVGKRELVAVFNKNLNKTIALLRHT